MEGLAIVAILVAGAFVIGTLRSASPSPACAWFVVLGVVFNFYAYFVFYGDSDPLSQARILLGFSVICVGLVSFIAGALLYSAYRGGKREIEAVDEEGFKQLALMPEEQRKANRILVAAAAVVLLPSWLYFVLLGYVPLFDGLSSVGNSGLDGLGTLQASRLSRDAFIDVNSARVPLQGLWELFRNIGTPFLVTLAIAQSRAGFSRWPRWVVLVLAVVTALMAGQRWPLIYTVVAVLATYEYLRPLKLSINRLRIAVAGAALFVIGIVISTLQKRTNETFVNAEDAVAFGFDNLVGRILIEQAQTPVLSYAYETFSGGQLGGRSYWLALQAYLPGEKTATFPVEFYGAVYRTDVGYTAPPDFFTEAYLNFDFFGVVVLALLWGVLGSWLDHKSFHRDRVTDIAIKGGAAAVFASTVFTGPSYLVGGAIVMTVLVGVLRLVERSDSKRRIEAARKKSFA